MIVGNPISAGNFTARNNAAILHSNINQRAQTIIGKHIQAHRKLAFNNSIYYTSSMHSSIEKLSPKQIQSLNIEGISTQAIINKL
jgi:hypothetical protein